MKEETRGFPKHPKLQGSELYNSRELDFSGDKWGHSLVRELAFGLGSKPGPLGGHTKENDAPKIAAKNVTQKSEKHFL